MILFFKRKSLSLYERSRLHITPSSRGGYVLNAIFTSGKNEQKVVTYHIEETPFGWLRIRADDEALLFLDRLESLLTRFSASSSSEHASSNAEDGIFIPSTTPLGRYDALRTRIGWHAQREGWLGILTDGQRIHIFLSSSYGLKEEWMQYHLQKARLGGIPGSFVTTSEVGLAFLYQTERRLERVLEEERDP